MATDSRLSRLAAVLRGIAAQGPVFIAYSGGLDSRFLAHAARLTGITPTLLHVAGPHVPARESEQAAARAGRMGLPLRIVPVDPLETPEVRANGRERCYFCKWALFARLSGEARAVAEAGEPVLCDGSNASDRRGYRPGLRALAELGVRSPLAEAGLEKPEIRELAALSGLEAPDQPSRPCLLTRFAYGVQPTLDLLASVDAAELAVEESWLTMQPPDAAPPAVPVPEYRVRLAGGDLVLQMALPPEREAAFMAALNARLAALGLPAPLLAAGEAVSGYFDRRV